MKEEKLPETQTFTVATPANEANANEADANERSCSRRVVRVDNYTLINDLPASAAPAEIRPKLSFGASVKIDNGRLT